MNIKYMGIIAILTCSFFLLPTNNYSSSINEDSGLQEKCGKYCKEYFIKTYGNGRIEVDNGQENWTYDNHYNKKLNKCFILTTTLVSTKNKMHGGKRKEIFDIREYTSYGEFLMIDDQLIFCNVLEEKCKSESEWDQLVKPYMKE
jgi:hypothetical protein